MLRTKLCIKKPLVIKKAEKQKSKNSFSNKYKLSQAVLGEVRVFFFLIFKGSTSVVKKCIPIVDGKETLAVKIIRSDDPEMKMTIYNEARILKKLNHENIIKIEEYLEENGTHYLV